MNRRESILALGTLSVMARHAFAQGGYPQRPIKLIVPYGAGGSADITSRVYADLLARQLHQPVVVENRPGAGGNIGTDAVAKAAPDGYTLGMTTSGPLVVNGALYPSMPFSPTKDLVTIAVPGQNSSVLVVRADSPFKTPADLVAYAKANPEKVSFSSSGVGTTSHLTAAWLRLSSNTEMLHVPFKEGAQAVTALLSGEVTFMCYHLSALQPQIDAGKLRAIGVTSATRLPSLGQVPTMIESGFSGFDLAVWYALVAPAQTSPAVLAVIQAAATQLLSMPSGRDRLLASGLELMPRELSMPAAARFVQAETLRWNQIVKSSGAKIDN